MAILGGYIVAHFNRYLYQLPMSFLSRPAVYLPIAILVVGLLGYVFLNAGSSPKTAAEIASTCESLAIGETRTIPAGRFVMGSENFYREEQPINSVSLNEFEIDIHEVTNAQFREFVDATGYVTSAERATEIGFPTNGSPVLSSVGWSFVEGASWRQPLGAESSIDGKDHYPVVQVSLEDARAYADWAERDLPTEAQWEFAARGSLDQADYAWGNQLTPDGEHLANTWQGAFPIVDTADDGFKGLSPIGCFRSNGYGLYDMIGNVWEWTDDAFYPTHEYAGQRLLSDTGEDLGHDPRQPDIPVGVIKGGSFLCAESYCKRYRPAARQGGDTLMGTNHIGFRTVSRGTQ